MTDYGAVFNDSVHKTFDDGFPLLMPRWGYVVSAFVLFLIGFFGFFLNLMVILLMFKDRQLWTPLNIILFNLVCSDFSVSVLGNPFTLVSALFHRWIFGRTMCVLYGFFMALLGITSITTLTVISFERYMMVTRPLNSRHLSQKGAALSVLFIWTYSLALTTPPLMGWGNYVNEAANISCSVNWHEQSMNTLTYILFLFALGQIVPLGIITFSYVNIIRTMKKNSQRLGRVSRAEARATSMVFIMIIAFTVAWTPYSVFALLEQFATEGIVSPGAGVIPALVAKSSICYDPLIYVGMNSQFRQSIKRLFGIHNKRNSRVDKAYNNTVMSPAQIQDATTRYNSSETNQSIIIRKNNDSKTLVIKNSTDPHNDVNLTQKNIELGTIQEYKTVSDAERSGETIYEEDSSNNKKQLDVFGESCQLLDRKSPVITILDTETMLFRKQSMVNQETDGSELYKNIYGNQAYEDHATDNVNAVSITDNERTGTHKVIKHSFSLDLATPPADTKKRKASIEATLEALVQPKGFFNDSVVSKIFEQDSLQGQDNLKTFLYTQEKSDSTENEL